MSCTTKDYENSFYQAPWRLGQGFDTRGLPCPLVTGPTPGTIRVLEAAHGISASSGPPSTRKSSSTLAPVLVPARTWYKMQLEFVLASGPLAPAEKSYTMPRAFVLFSDQLLATEKSCIMPPDFVPATPTATTRIHHVMEHSEEAGGVSLGEKSHAPEGEEEVEENGGREK
jgi:hypothetical protein